MKCHLGCLRAVALVAFFPSPLQAIELTAVNGSNYDRFGRSVGVFGDTVLVGADGDDDPVSSAGSAYVFVNVNTENPTQYKMGASDPEPSLYFGYSVSLSGGTALIGAYRDNNANGDGAGAAYVKTDVDTGGPYDEFKIIAPDGKEYDYFGVSVSMSGSTALVGAEGEDSKGNNAGAAYVFVNANTGNPTAYKLTASDGGAYDSFGNSVSMSGSTALVGAYLNSNTNGANAGGVYVYRNADTQTPDELKLIAPNGASEDWFGASVSQSGTNALVGAPGDDDLGSNAGGVWFFKGTDTGNPSAEEFFAFDGEENSFFGACVSLSGDRAIVGAYGDDDQGTDAGAAYVLDGLASGSPTQFKITASHGTAGDYLGYSVSMDGDQFVIGAHGRNLGEGMVISSFFSQISKLDVGASFTFENLKVVSTGNWGIGKSTDSNAITMTADASMIVTNAGKTVHIGEDAGADGNSLTVEQDAALRALGIYVGAAGNTNNSLIINGTVTANNVTVAGGSFVGGDGMLNADLILLEDADYLFDPFDTFECTGTVSLPSTFGIDNLLGLDGSVPVGTYIIIGGSPTDFSLLNLENWGSGNAFNLGGGKSAYFQQGSLQVKVVPEPSTWVLLLLGEAELYAILKGAKWS